MTTTPHKNICENIVALTGSIGSGKTTVARIFQELGASIVSADELAREVVLPGTEGLCALTEAFGKEVLTEEGLLNRKKLAQIIFHNDKERKELEKILHPRIKELSRERFLSLQKQDSPLIIYDIPLLFEARREEEGFRAIIVVFANQETCIRRIVARDNISEEEAKARIDSQMPVDKKLALADVAIENNRSLEELSTLVQKVFHELTSEKKLKKKDGQETLPHQ